MDMQVRLTQFSHGGGCGCKIAPGVLRADPREERAGLDARRSCWWASRPATTRPSTSINERQAIVATTDFFMPIVDDPFDFGAIAATNAISDVYAMGGQPLFALALVGMPVNQIPLEVIRKILEGGESVCARAGIPIAGGHTIDSVEPIYGLVAIGLVDPHNLKRNAGARRATSWSSASRSASASISAALKKGRARRRRLQGDDRVDDEAQHAGHEAGELRRRARTDRRDGFGLLGHLLEIAKGSKAAARLDWQRDPAPSRRLRFRPRGNCDGRIRS